MARYLKQLYASGILGDWLRGELSSKPNNTVEQVSCIRHYEDGTSDLYTHETITADMVVYGKDGVIDTLVVSDNKEDQNVTQTLEQQMKHATLYKRFVKILLGAAPTATVYITYWYDNKKYITYYHIPDEPICFPVYDTISQTTVTSNEDGQVLLSEDDDIDTFVAFIQIAFRPNETTATTTSSDETRAQSMSNIDITPLAQLFKGPKNDFHGKTDLVHMLDYHMFTNKKTLALSKLISCNNVTPYIKVIYGDLHIEELSL